VRALWRLVRDHRDLRLLVTAGLVSMTGDSILSVGIAFYVYSLTGSTLASAGTMLALYLPSILLSSLAGVFVDRWNRIATMVVSNVLLAVGLLPLLTVHDPGQVWIIYAVAAWEGIVELFFAPAEQALLPRLVADADLTTANALNGQIRDVSRLVGAGLGGVIIATGGLTALALADAATFLGSALLISRIRASGRAEGPVDGDKPTLAVSRLRRVGQEWAAGMRMSISQPVLRVIMAFTFVALVGEGVMGTLFVPFVRDVLHGDGQQYGLIVSVQAIGGIAGGLVAASVGQRVSAVSMFGVGSIVFGFIDLVMFVYPVVYVHIWPAVVCMIAVGLPGAVVMAGYNTLLQRNTTDAYRGRVFGALGAVQGVAILVGTLTAGILGESVPVIPVLSYQGVGYMLAGVIVVVTLRPGRQGGTTAGPVEAAGLADGRTR
jgi:predicted MFS family arabinose efflux permease